MIFLVKLPQVLSGVKVLSSSIAQEDQARGGTYARIEARNDQAATNVLSPSLHNEVSLRIHVVRLWFAKHALCRGRVGMRWGTWAMLFPSLQGGKGNLQNRLF